MMAFARPHPACLIGLYTTLGPWRSTMKFRRAFRPDFLLSSSVPHRVSVVSNSLRNRNQSKAGKDTTETRWGTEENRATSSRVSSRVSSRRFAASRGHDQSCVETNHTRSMGAFFENSGSTNCVGPGKQPRPNRSGPVFRVVATIPPFSGLPVCARVEADRVCFNFRSVEWSLPSCVSLVY